MYLYACIHYLLDFQLFVVVMLGVEPRVLGMVSKLCTTEPYPQPVFSFLTSETYCIFDHLWLVGQHGDLYIVDPQMS